MFEGFKLIVLAARNDVQAMFPQFPFQRKENSAEFQSYFPFGLLIWNPLGARLPLKHLSSTDQAGDGPVGLSIVAAHQRNLEITFVAENTTLPFSYIFTVTKF